MTSLLRQRYLLDPGRAGLTDAVGLRTYRFALRITVFLILCVVVVVIDPNPVNWWVYTLGLVAAATGIEVAAQAPGDPIGTRHAALSSALVVVEAQEKSGTMSTVNHAERYGKPVFVVPGSIYSPNSAGTNALLREGRAKAVCKPGDLFGVLGLRGAAAPAAVRSAPDPMSETERRVLACIGPKAKGVEELGAASGLPTGLLLGTLMKLELAGRVTCLPGKRYILR